MTSNTVRPLAVFMNPSGNDGMDTCMPWLRPAATGLPATHRSKTDRGRSAPETACAVGRAAGCDVHPIPRDRAVPPWAGVGLNCRARTTFVNKNSLLREGLEVLNHKAKSAAMPAALTLALLAANGVAWADAPQPEIPTCDKKIGTLAVTEPQNQWWLQYNLESPEALIKVYVSQVEVLHAGGSRQGARGGADGAGAGRQRRDARRLQHRQGPDESGRLCARPRRGHEEQRLRGQEDWRHVGRPVCRASPAWSPAASA